MPKIHIGKKYVVIKGGKYLESIHFLLGPLYTTSKQDACYWTYKNPHATNVAKQIGGKVHKIDLGYRQSDW